MNCLKSDADKLAECTELNFLELDQQTKIHLDRGTSTAKRWFDDHRERVLAAHINDRPTEQVEVLLRFVQWHFKEGQYEQGLIVALRAVHVARSSALLALLRRSLNLLGLLYSRVGDSTKATICYVEGLSIAERIGDRVGKAAIIANLAELRFNSGLIAESIALNRYVVDMAAHEPQFIQLMADAHHNIAVASLLLSDLDTATREIEQAVRFSCNPSNQFLAHQSVIVAATCCRILIEIGLVGAARRSAEYAEFIAIQMNSPPALVQASLACALCDAAQGNVGLAFERIRHAHQRLSAHDPLYRDLLEIETICHTVAGHKTDATRLRKRHLSHMARFQRNSVIRQIAAFQRSVRTLRAVPENELFALPIEVRKRLLHSWKNAEREDIFREHLEALASLADQREDGGGEHCLRVGRLVEMLANRIGYSSSHSRTLGLAARLHDIGKLATPDVLLLKRSSLTAAELEIVRRHTIEGSQILTDILSTMESANHLRNDAEAIRIATEIALHHHEWWDGTGYPRGIRKEQIPESARVTAVADAFDELTTPRPYRHTLSISNAIDDMKKLRGRHFDPRLCDAFGKLVGDLQVKYGKELEAFVPHDAELSPYQRASRVIEGIVSSSQMQTSTKTTKLQEQDPLEV